MFEQHDDAPYPKPEHSVWERLNILRRDKVVAAENAPGKYAPEWVKWWEENREKQGPIPEPLRGIEEKYARNPDEPTVPQAGEKSRSPTVTPPRRKLPLTANPTRTEASPPNPPPQALADAANSRKRTASPKVQILAIVGGCVIVAAAWCLLRRRS